MNSYKLVLKIEELTQKCEMLQHQINTINLLKPYHDHELTKKIVEKTRKDTLDAFATVHNQLANSEIPYY